MIANKIVSKVPQVAQKAFFATAAKAAVPKPPLKAVPPPPKALSAIPKFDLKTKREPEPFFSDDFVVDSSPITLPSTPVQPISKPIQPFAKRPAVSKPTIAAPPTLATPATPTIPTLAIPLPAAVAAPVSPASTLLPPHPAITSPAAAPRVRGKPGTPATKPKPPTLIPIPKPPSAQQNAVAQGKEIARQLQGRTPAQLLTQIAQLQQHNATLQSQLVYHSAVEAIYGESGFNQLRNLIAEFTEEEGNILKGSGFESENVILLLEARQRDLCLQFTQTMGADLAKHITAHVKKLKDQHRQSASAATATQQTLRNAGVPDAVISSTLVGLQPHLDELQTRILRWEKLKADVDLLIATHSNNH